MAIRLRAAVAAALVVVSLAGCGAGSGKGTLGATAQPTSGNSSQASSTGPAPKNPSSLATVKESELPAEGKKTLSLIRKGGPFPNARDGVNFGNFEKVLPVKQGGYYKEYTVKTPGVSTRGARRIIVGKGHEKYYTADHYTTFRFIEEGK